MQAAALQEGGAAYAAYEASGVVTHLSGVIMLQLFDPAGNLITTAHPLHETTATWQVTPFVNGTGDSARLRIGVNGGVGQGYIKWVARIHTTELLH